MIVMNKTSEIAILVLIVLAAVFMLVVFLPEAGIKGWSYMAVCLSSVAAAAYFLPNKKIRNLSFSLKEQTVASDRARAEIARLRGELEKATTKDELTGLHNLDHFKILVNHERALTKRADYKFTLAMLEVDQYFEIIRNFGNAQANEFLNIASRVIVAALREVDHVARVSDGRFVMTLSGASEQDSVNVMHRVSKLVSQIKIEEEGGEGFEITTSSGLTSYHGSENVDELIDHSRKALDHAVKQGRNRVAGYMFDKGQPAEA